MNLLRAALAEAIGTFAFLTIGLLTLVSATAIGQGDAHVILLAVPFGFGLGLFAAIWLVGHVSGGHFNPAVTLGALLDGRITIVGAISYVIAQLAGAFGATFVIFFVVGQSFVAYTVTQPAVDVGPAFLTETLLTAVFVGVILTVTERQPKVAAFAIGLTLTVIHFAAIPITGASVNPARTLGPAVVSGHYEDIWVYLTAPFLGALIGWGVYRLFGSPEEDEDEEEEEYEDDEEEDEFEEEATG